MSTQAPKPPSPQAPAAASGRGFVQGLLAVAVTAYVGVVMWGPLGEASADGGRAAQAVGAIVLPFLGTVLGFYFGGASGAQVAAQAIQQVREALLSSANVKAVSQRELAAAGTDIEDALAAEMRAREALDALKRENDQWREQLRAETRPAPTPATAQPRDGDRR
jgi:hypothetical protein